MGDDPQDEDARWEELKRSIIEARKRKVTDFNRLSPLVVRADFREYSKKATFRGLLAWKRADIKATGNRTDCPLGLTSLDVDSDDWDEKVLRFVRPESEDAKKMTEAVWKCLSSHQEMPSYLRRYFACAGCSNVFCGYGSDEFLSQAENFIMILLSNID